MPIPDQLDHLLTTAEDAEAAGDWGRAANAYVEALTIAPDSADAAFGLGCAWLRAGDAAGALRYLIQATELDPDDALYWRELGIALTHAGHLEESLAAFGAAQECDFTDETLFLLIAATMFRLQRFAEVVAYTDAMPLLLRRYPELLILQGSAQLALGRIAAARAAASRGIALFPDNARLATLAGAIEAAAGDHATAERHLRQAIALDRRSYDATVGLAALRIGAGADTGPGGVVRRALEFARSVAPDRPEVPLLLATLAFQAGDAAELERWTVAGLEADPGQPSLLFFLGWLCAGQGRRDIAEAVFAAALLIDPSHQACQFALARCLLRDGDRAGAAAHLRATVRIGAATAQGKAAAALLGELG